MNQKPGNTSQSEKEEWEIEDVHIPKILNSFQLHEPKCFSREVELQNSISVNEEIHEEHKEIQSCEKYMRSFGVIDHFRSSKFKISSNKADFDSRKTLGISNIPNSIDDLKSKSRFFKTMVKLYLVKKFIRNLRENTPYRKPQGLKWFHFSLINDLSSFPENKRKAFEELIATNKIIKKMLSLFTGRCFKHFLLIVLKKFNLIIYPNNNLRLIWDSLQILITILYFILIPIQISFESNLSPQMTSDHFKAFSFFLFSMDIFINFNTAYYNKGELIISRVKIFSNYFYGRFFSDFLSLFYIIATELSGASSHSLAIRFTGFLYLLRLQNLSRAISRFEEFLFTDENTYNLISFIRLIFNIVFFSHWAACMWKLVGEWEEYDGWIHFYGLQKESTWNQYVTSLYYVVVVTNTVGFGDIVAQTINERVFTVCFIFAACIIFAYTLNQIGIILQNINKNDRELKRMMHAINGYMKFKKIDFGLKVKIRNYLEYIWQAEKMQNLNETQEIINRLSKSLKEELLLNANGFALKNVPLFSSRFSEDSLRKIACQMKEINLTPEDILYHENDSDNNIYIIRDGEIELFAETPNIEKKTSLKILKKGDYFGEISFFSGFPRKTSAKSLSFSSLFMINREDFLRVIRENSFDYEQFFQIKDQISLYQNFSGIHLKCYACKKLNHYILNCPLLHLTFSPERILEKYTFSLPQSRTRFPRIRGKKVCNSRKNFQKISISAKKFTKEIVRFSKIDSEETFKNNESEDMKFEGKSPTEPVEELSENLKQESENMINSIDPLKKGIVTGEECQEIRQARIIKRVVTAEDMLNGSFGALNSADNLSINQQKMLLIDKFCIEIDVVKNYEVYFPQQNVDNLIEKINSMASKKERKMKNYQIFQTFFKSRKSRINSEVIKKSRTKSFYDAIVENDDKNQKNSSEKKLKIKKKRPSKFKTGILIKTISISAKLNQCFAKICRNLRGILSFIKKSL